MDIGSKLKSIRLKNDLTLAELASRCELTVGFLSQLENDISSPSIATLRDILEALGTSLTEFFQDEKEEKMVFTDEDFFESETNDYMIQWIVPDAQKRQMEPIIIKILPKCRSMLIRPHLGEEFGFILKGKIKLNYGKKSLEVNSGESFYLLGDKTHYLFNDEENEAIVLWVSTPPSF